MVDAPPIAKILHFPTPYEGDVEVACSDDLSDYVRSRARVGFVRSVAKQKPEWNIQRLEALHMYLLGEGKGELLPPELQVEFDKCQADWRLLDSLYPSRLLTELAAQADYEDISAPLPPNVRCMFEYCECRPRHRRH